ncbi:thiamine phosphate synthase [Oceanimonas sp. CAM02]|uniref:thiamine phosphate synthase n=1 Tax=Oceanimonas sp. CAM02 TaxID=3080336 RepID=UPI002936C6EE|nr:thiamine phosphate synthase [Oceanimonas sp. CAM02]MDV2858889.1 thiamine phosphate synthase [Oceanimonas sp. CAM02]
MNPYRLYLVTDEQLPVERLQQVVREAVAGGVTLVQVREKHGDVRAFIERAEAVQSVLKGTGIPLIINDRVDVALAVNADGVHLGQSDMPAACARRLLGPDKLLGLSVETEQQLFESESLPIDYLGLSAIFATPTKTDLKKHWGIDGLQRALAVSARPIVAIGGIHQNNLGIIAQTGVHGVALVSAICSASCPQTAARTLRAILE